jgi:4-hydroxybenzoate polyprenyltransferase
LLHRKNKAKVADYDKLSAEAKLSADPPIKYSDSVSQGWINSFVSRQPDLKIRKSSPLELDRAKFATPENISAYFDSIEALYTEHNYHPSMIANFDESMVDYNKKKLVVIGRAESKRQYAAESLTNMHITIGVTIFADGTHPRHLIILPLQTMPCDIDIADYPEFDWSGQTNGWIDKDILESHTRKVIVPMFDIKRQMLGDPNARGLFLVDGHSTRLNLELLTWMASQGIDVQAFVSHCSHVQQPLDLCCFGVFKSSDRCALSAGQHIHRPNKKIPSYSCFAGSDKLHESLAHQNII